MKNTQPHEMYDAVIIGGGPAGLTAAIYLARANRSVMVVDCSRPSRSDWTQVNRNYLGFPDGISIVELCARGRQQASQFGAHFCDAEIETIQRDGDTFTAIAPNLRVRARSVVLATGVTDRWVEFPGYEEFIGRTMHWCIVCDGYEMRDQRVMVVGHDEHAAELAIQMQNYTDQVMVVTNHNEHSMPAEMLQALADRDIRLIEGNIVGARSRQLGVFTSVRLDTGEEIAIDHLFSAQGAVPNSELARQLGVELSSEGYIRVDTEAHTNIPGVYAAGDVTRLFSHQVVTAAHEGGTAASALNYRLYRHEQEAFRPERIRRC